MPQGSAASRQGRAIIRGVATVRNALAIPKWFLWLSTARTETSDTSHPSSARSSTAVRTTPTARAALHHPHGDRQHRSERDPDSETKSGDAELSRQQARDTQSDRVPEPGCRHPFAIDEVMARPLGAATSAHGRASIRTRLSATVVYGASRQRSDSSTDYCTSRLPTHRRLSRAPSSRTKQIVCEPHVDASPDGAHTRRRARPILLSAIVLVRAPRASIPPARRGARHAGHGSPLTELAARCAVHPVSARSLGRRSQAAPLAPRWRCSCYNRTRKRKVTNAVAADSTTPRIRPDPPATSTSLMLRFGTTPRFVGPANTLSST